MASVKNRSAQILKLQLPARFRVGKDQLGYRIEITDKAAVRPDRFGRVRMILHEDGTNPKAFMPDAKLVARLIEVTFKPHERAPIFRSPMSETRRHALEAICEAANDVVHAKEYDEWIGPVH